MLLKRFIIIKLKSLVVAGLTLTTALGFLSVVHAADSDNSNNLVAIVNGIDIKQFEYDIAAQSLQAELANLSKAQQQQKILQFLIDMKLMSEAAKKDGVNERQEYKQKISYLSEQTLNNVFFTKTILSKIDNAALLAYYNLEMKKIKPKKEMRARHILLESQDKGNEVLALLADGGDFEKLAEEYSTGPTKTQGGDLGYFGDSEMDAEFTNATAGLKIGEYTKELVKTKFGYHIILLVDMRDKPLPSFEKIKTKLYDVLVQKRVEELSNNLRKSAKIELFVEQEALDVKKPDIKKTVETNSSN